MHSLLRCLRGGDLLDGFVHPAADAVCRARLETRYIGRCSERPRNGRSTSQPVRACRHVASLEDTRVAVLKRRVAARWIGH